MHQAITIIKRSSKQKGWKNGTISNASGNWVRHAAAAVDADADTIDAVECWRLVGGGDSSPSGRTSRRGGRKSSRLSRRCPLRQHLITITLDRRRALHIQRAAAAAAVRSHYGR